MTSIQGMLLREGSAKAVTIMIVAALAVLLAPAASQAKKNAKPRVSVTAWSSEPLGSTNTVEPGGKMNVCGAAATSTTKLYAYMKFRHRRKGREVTIKWTLNGLLYANAEQTWSLAASGRAAADMSRAPTQLRFPSGLYRFSLIYDGRRIATSTMTLNTDC